MKTNNYQFTYDDIGNRAMKVKSKNLKVKYIENCSTYFPLFPSPFSISFSWNGENRMYHLHYI